MCNFLCNLLTHDDSYKPDVYHNKKLSYRRETARQLPTWGEGGVRPFSPLPSSPSGYTYGYG